MQQNVAKHVIINNNSHIISLKYNEKNSFISFRMRSHDRCLQQ